MNDIYIKLSDYLNTAIKNIDKIDEDYLPNISYIDHISQSFLDITKCLNGTYTLEDNVSIFEIIDICRNYLKEISEEYLEEFDNVINNGVLEINDEVDSKCYFRDGRFFIDFRRRYNYYDAPILLHEFFHYLNYCGYYSKNRHILTEAVSIYFEIDLLKKMIKDEVISDTYLVMPLLRIATDSKCFLSYSLPLYCVYNFGEISEENIEFLDKYVLKVDKESFDNECMETYKKLDGVAKKYKDEHPFDFNEKEYEMQLRNSLMYEHTYILGTLFAYFALKYSNSKKVKDFNDTFYMNESDNLQYVLDYFGFDVENTFDVLEDIRKDASKVKVMKTEINSNSRANRSR